MENEIKSGSVPVLSIGAAAKILAEMYTKAILSGTPLKRLPSVMLWGPPGVGKSQGIRQVAELVSDATEKRTVITDVRLLLFNPIDLRGIPTSNADKTLAVWLKPQIFQMDESDDVINILFLDELSAAKILAEMYTKAILSGTPLKRLPSVMLWGPPGVGKSQGIRQVAELVSDATEKRTVITDVRLLLFNPIDLRGIPTSNADKTLAVWLKPQIFQMDESDDVINILFLDELSAAPQSVQAAAFQITLDRMVGEHRLPDNCIVVAAGNRVTDRSVAFKMPKALANRMLHLEIEGDYTSWREWAVKAGIHPMILGFLSFRRDHLMRFSPNSDDLAFATPRAWEKVSNLLRIMGDDPEKIYPLIAGLVGAGVSAELISWTRVYDSLPSIKDIFDGKNPPIPVKADTLYALVSAMTTYASAHKDEMDRIENSVAYGANLPADFAAVLFKDYMNLDEGYREKMLLMPPFARWLQQKGMLLNGSVR